MNKSSYTTPEVSVVMAVHNTIQYLPEAVESILSQTYRNFEFIIIDDGSTDGSDIWLAEKAKMDTRIRLVRQENIGLTKSLNRGLSLAKGKLIARMDGDDIALPTRLEDQMEAFQKSGDIVLVCSEVEYITEDGIPLGIRNSPKSHVEIRRRLLLGNGGALTHPAVTIRTSALSLSGFYDERFTTCQDLDLFLRLSEVGLIVCLPEVHLHWRQHANSVNHTRSETWMDMKRMAISSTIDRIGADRFTREMFPVQERMNAYPSDSLALARIAASRGRLKSAWTLTTRALRGSEPKLRVFRFQISLLKRYSLQLLRKIFIRIAAK